MISFVSTLATVSAVALGLLGAWYAVRDRLIDDLVLMVAASLLVALLVQAVVGSAHSGQIGAAGERGTFLAYAWSLPLLPIGASWLAIKEKSRFGMVVVVVGALSCLVMTVRMTQIWSAVA